MLQSAECAIEVRAVEDQAQAWCVVMDLMIRECSVTCLVRLSPSSPGIFRSTIAEFKALKASEWIGYPEMRAEIVQAVLATHPGPHLRFYASPRLFERRQSPISC
jgi:hypothetical protein